MRQPADPQLRRLFKKMYVVIKLVHHLQNVAPKQGKEGPRMISRMVEELASMIRPAGPTPQTMLMIKGNAENWGYNTLTILMDHYKEGLDQALEDLDEILIPDWKTAFQVSVRWAKRSLQRLTRDAIDHAEALITSRVVATEGQDVQPRPQMAERVTTAVQTSPEEPRRMVRFQERPVLTGSTRPLAKERPVVKPVATRTTSTPNSDNGEGDWELPSFQNPQDQRQVQRRTRGVVLREEDLPIGQNQGDLIDWDPTEGTPSQDSPQGSMVELFTVDEVEEEERAGYTVLVSSDRNYSPVPTSRSSSQEFCSPIQHVAQIHEVPGEVEGTTLPSVLTDFTRGRFQPRRHMNTQRKLTDWSLIVEKKWVLMGDSNLSRLPDHSCEDLQIEAFPGGHFRHAQALIEKTCPPRDMVVEKIILSFGINSRENKSKETTIKNLQAAVRSAKKKFPYAEIWIPLVNYSTNLPMEEQLNLQTLNEHIRKNMGFIRLLPSHLFQTEADDIHWTEETGKAMFQHWWRELNWPTL